MICLCICLRIGWCIWRCIWISQNEQSQYLPTFIASGSNQAISQRFTILWLWLRIFWGMIFHIYCYLVYWRLDCLTFLDRMWGHHLVRNFPKIHNYLLWLWLTIDFFLWMILDSCFVVMSLYCLRLPTYHNDSKYKTVIFLTMWMEQIFIDIAVNLGKQISIVS